MNLLGHAHVSLAVGRDHPEVVLGALLPDLAGMAGVRVYPGRLWPALAEGVRGHHAADGAFHAQPAFLAGAAAVRRALEDRGVGRGPARAVGHVGWELLLDGTLLGGPAECAYRAARALAPGAAGAVAPAQAARFERFLRRWSAQVAVPPYDDPAWVAGRVHDMVAGRARLALAQRDVAVVAAVLVDHHDAVVASATALLADTARETARALDGPAGPA